MGGFGFWRTGRQGGSMVVRLVVASLVTMAGALGAVVLSGAVQAGAFGSTYYAYPNGGATAPLFCPQTSVVADQCTLTQALAIVAAGGTVALAVSGDESDPTTFYVGNFTVSSGSDLSSPLTIEPAAGVTNPILDGNGGSSVGCPTVNCDGPVLTTPAGAFVDLSGVTVQSALNSAGNGGGVQNSGALRVDRSVFTNDSAPGGFGGAISNGDEGVEGDLVVTSSMFSSDSAVNGGAISSGGNAGGDGVATIASSTFTGDSAANGGGAIAVGVGGGTGTVEISSSSFSNNVAAEQGGAVDNGDAGSGTLTVTSSTFFDNSAGGTGGGAIANATFGTGQLDVSTSTFATNSAAFAGGAIDNAESGTGTASVDTSTFWDDSSGADGGAIDNGDFGGSGTMTVTGSTLTGGTAQSGGNMATFFGSTSNLAADIIVNGGVGGDCGGISSQFIDDGYNVNDDTTCPFTTSDGSVKDSTAITAYVGQLGANGGPTQTIPLNASPRSPVGPDPALNAIPATFDLPGGTAFCSTTDQRGVPRRAPCDMGAYETHPGGVETGVTLVGSANAVTVGSSVTYTATVNPITDGETGSAVTFTQDGSLATCSGYSFDGQTATCTLSYPSPGTHEIRATYGGDTVFAASAPSAPWTTSVTTAPPVATTTTLTSSATGVAPGQSLTLTATVTPTQAGPLPGSVTFEDDGQPISCGTGSTAFDGTTATCVVSFPAPSLPQHEVTAVYSGDATAAGSTSSPLLITVAFANPGYRVAAADGGVFAFGAPYDGSMGGQHLNAPIVGMATDPATGGYWLVASDGGIFSFDAPFHGSMGGQPLNQPIVGMAATADGTGYWEVAADGGIFAFGTAAFHGSMGGQHLNAPVVGMAPDNTTGGYWEVSSDGGIFSFGAPFDGSTGSLHLDAPMIGMAATPGGGGYWLAASDGGVFTYGDATFHGSNADTNLASPIVGIAADIYTGGYWLVAANGATHAYGAPEDGQFPDLGGASRAVAIAPG